MIVASDEHKITAWLKAGSAQAQLQQHSEVFPAYEVAKTITVK